MRVVVSDPLTAEGLDILRAAGRFEILEVDGSDPAALRKALAGAEALLVRSGTKVTDEVMGWAPALRLVGRAGTGVDNIDMDAASRRGVVVMNTPDANSIAAAEHTLALLLALLRNVAPAAASLAAGRWDRTRFLGQEMAGKTIGIVGFGRIGREIARRCRAFDMTVLTHDPFITDEVARQNEALLVTLNDLFDRSDIVTLHVPLTRGTRHLVDAGRIARMKRGARIVNCARGGLVDEAALLAGLESGQLAGAALDVFETEPPADGPLLRRPDVVATPHLGASTREAQQNVSSELARQVRDFFLTGAVRNAVNMPSLSAEAYQQVAPFLDLVERLGALAAGLAPGLLQKIRFEYQGDVAALPMPPITLAGLKGVLSTRAGESVNFVNARLMATEQGIEVSEAFQPAAEDYASLIRLTVETARGRCELAGTLLRGHQPRVVAIDGYEIDAVPVGTLMVLQNDDVPGVVGAMGTLLGEAGVNIARITWGRAAAGTTALTVIQVDSVPPPALLTAMRADARVRRVDVVVLPAPHAART